MPSTAHETHLCVVVAAKKEMTIFSFLHPPLHAAENWYTRLICTFLHKYFP